MSLPKGAEKKKVIYVDEIKQAIVSDKEIRGKAFAAIMKHLNAAPTVDAHARAAEGGAAMSQRREKIHRRIARREYLYELERWRRREPPMWRFISHWLWKKDKPKPPKGAYIWEK